MKTVDSTPDFYLRSFESRAFEPIRRCYKIGPVSVSRPLSLLRVAIDKPLLLNNYVKPVDELILSPRGVGTDFSDTSGWPLLVNVYVPPYGLVDRTHISDDELGTFAAVAQLHRTLESAEKYGNDTGTEAEGL